MSIDEALTILADMFIEDDHGDEQLRPEVVRRLSEPGSKFTPDELEAVEVWRNEQARKNAERSLPG